MIVQALCLRFEVGLNGCWDGSFADCEDNIWRAQILKLRYLLLLKVLGDAVCRV